ncbi:MAG: hypothetical protein OXG27_07980 [Chloroflexi bacterium]|nr:hypothetical protein [Chloroflexota bacterium]
MVMFSQQKMIQEIREQVALVWKRSPDYRNHLAVALIDVLRAQDQGLSERSRREQVKRIIETLGAKALRDQEAE